MKKYYLFIPFLVFTIILLVFFYFLIIDRNPSEIPSALINKTVPIFKTSSLIENKNFISIEEFGHETTIVNFFATWCEPCRAEHKYIKLLADKGLKIIGVNYKDDTELVLQWLEKLGNPYSNVAIDKNGQIAIDWGVYGIPETFIVNKNNIIYYRHVGPITKKKYNTIYLKAVENRK